MGGGGGGGCGGAGRGGGGGRQVFHANVPVLLTCLFALAREPIFIKTHAIEIRFLQDRKIHCLPARMCIFQPGNLTGCSREGVKTVSILIGKAVIIQQG